LEFFRKFAAIFTSQDAPTVPVPLTPVAIGKILNQKNFPYFFGTP